MFLQKWDWNSDFFEALLSYFKTHLHRINFFFLAKVFALFYSFLLLKKLNLVLIIQSIPSDIQILTDKIVL